jgi:hypothetical protein
MNSQNVHTGEGMPQTQAAEKKKNQLKIDNEVYSIEASHVSKQDILQLANKNPACRYQVYQEINPHKELNPVTDAQLVDLKEPGIEKFITKQISEVSYELTGASFTTSELFLTPSQILEKKFKDKASQYYLKQIVGQTTISYEGKPDQQIPMCPDSKFLSIYTGPMKVS